MSLLVRSRNVLGQSICVLALLSISVFAAEQHKSESREPAQHASRPSGHGNEGHAPQGHAAPSHSAGPSHSSGQSHTSAASHESRPSSGGHNAGAGAGNTTRNSGNVSRPGNAGNRGNNAGGNRGNTPGNRAGTAGNANRGNAGRGGNFGGNRGGNNNAGNRGMSAHTAPGRNVSLRGGGSASVRPNGQIRSINRNGMQIHNNIHGGRTVVSEHNGVRVVNNFHGGYVQRSYLARGGHSYYSRTYFDHGSYRVGIYRGYYYHGYHYYGYYPGAWYHPGFYGWGWHPWGVGVSWGIGVGGWGWGGSPWWGYYGGWFNPYPVYASPAFWLTDYLLAADLQAAYAARADANAAAAGAYDQGSANYGDSGGGQANYSGSNQVTLSPEVKEAIAEEVKAQLQAQEQQAATQGGVEGSQGSAPTNMGDEVPPALDPARRTFVVDTPITVVSNGQECELTGGDVITRLTDTPDNNQQVNASVSASKKGECAAGAQVAVTVDELQEMHNHFEEQLNSGLKTLAEKQGTNGMPKAPDASTVASDLPTPTPDQNASKELSDQQAQADQAEAQAKQEVAQGGGGQE